MEGMFGRKNHDLFLTICVLAICVVTYRGVVVYERVNSAEMNNREVQVLIEKEKITAKIEALEMMKQGMAEYKNSYIKAIERLNTEIGQKMANYETIIAEQAQALEDAKEIIAPVTIEPEEDSPPPSNGKYNEEQVRLLTLAYQIGSTIGLPETVQAILIQETQAGAYGDRIGDTNLSLGKRSYGVMQMKVATARGILKKHPKIVHRYFPKRKTLKKVRDEEIIIELIQNDAFAINMATLNVAYHRKKSKSWSVAVIAYNTGQRAANKVKNPKKHKYYINIVKRIIKDVRPFNTEFGLNDT